MILKKNNQIPLKAWEKFIQSNKFATPFQSPSYFHFFNSVPDLSAKVYAVIKNSEIEAICVVTIYEETGFKSIFSSRAIIYGGPIISNDTALEKIIYEINNDLKGKVIYLETRNFNDYSEFKTVFEENDWEYIPWLNYHLDCSNLPMVKKNMSSSRGRGIRKAQKKGATFREADNLEDVKRFYEILKDLYKNKIKKPLPSWAFFETFYKDKVGKYFLVYFEGKVIGGIMCPILNNKAIYEYYVCGMDYEYRDQKPSVLATWAAIDYALKNDIPLFDFMGAGNPAEDYGVREFKKRFGGEEVEFGRFRKILNKPLYETGKLGLKVLSKF